MSDTLAEDGLDSDELAAGVEALISELCDSRALHEFTESGALRIDALSETAREIGCFSLSLPEHFGGLGLTVGDMIGIYKVVGAFLPPLPVFAVALASDLLSTADSEAWLARIGDGANAAVALPPFDDLPQLTGGPDQMRCSGSLPFVLEGADADILLTPAVHDGERVWLALEASAPGVSLERVKLVDETRNAARAALVDTPVVADSFIARGSGCAALEDRLLMHASLALAADSTGGAEAIIDKTLDYMKIREQFGRPIGSFQALKHRAANLHLSLVASQALLEEAVQALQSNAQDARTLSLLACAHAADSYAMIAEDCLQLHGGIGFTRDHDAHLYLKRAKLNQALLGGTQALRDLAARGD